MMEIAKYLPKLQMLASSLADSNQSRIIPPKKRPVKNVSHKLAKKKVTLVKRPIPPQSLPDVIPRFGQPGMVYVPASWVQHNPGKGAKCRSSLKKRSTLIEQNTLVRSPGGAAKKTGIALHRNMGLKTATLADTKKAALALERKRLDFLKYLQDVQEEISALQFPVARAPKKRPTKNKKRATLGTKLKRKRTEGSKKSKAKSANTSAKPDVENIPNDVDEVLSSATDSAQSTSSMLSQTSSSSTQMKIIDDAFSNNYKRER